MPLDKTTFDCSEPSEKTPTPLAPPDRDDVKYGDLRSALFSLPDEYSDSYDLWMKEVAIPLKNAGEEYFALFNEFSSRSAKYQGEEDCRKRWDGIGLPSPGRVKTVASIFFNAKKHGWSSKAAPEASQNCDERYPTRTMGQLLAAEFDEEYVVDGVLIRGVPCIIGGPAKSLKTGQLMDLAYNLATGGKFLGRFQCTKSKVLILTGESGGAALQRRLRTLSVNNGGVVADDASFLISEALPKFSSEIDLKLLQELIVETGVDVVIIDPVYMCMGSGEAGNIQAQGELLWGITEVTRKAKATLIIAHHVTKAAARKKEPLTLEDLTQAGFDAWARQWWLVSRREAFELGSGVHKLQVAAGNCSSHSMEWAIDIDEGTKDDPKWVVEVNTLGECRKDLAAGKVVSKNEKDFGKIKELLSSHTSMAPSDIRNQAGISVDRWKVVLPAAEEEGLIKQVPGKRKNSKHYALADSYAIAT